LRRASIVAVAASGVLSVSFMLYAGRRNPSVVLMALFFVWVLSPFVGLLWMEKSRKRASLPGLALIIAIVSAVIYGYVTFGPPRQKVAAAFLIVPLVSWLLIAVMAAFGKRSAGT